MIAVVESLKEQMERDRFAFLNSKEFGEEMLIDGVPCLGSWDEEQEQPVRQFFGAEWDTVSGVFTRERALYFMRSDGTAAETPAPRQELDINGKLWTVRNASPSGGIVKVILYRNES